MSFSSTVEAIICLGVFALAGSGCVESAYPKTDVGKIEMKEIPKSTVLVSAVDGSYFDRANPLFRRLFNYIKKNEVAMTVPVEAEMEPGTMKFYVGSQGRSTDLRDTSTVKVVTAAERTVVSLGCMGEYDREDFDKAVAKLQAWLKKHPEHASMGKPYAVFWDSPFTPGPLRRFEVHVVVVPRKQAHP